jgi:hypothetical protein
MRFRSDATDSAAHQSVVESLFPPTRSQELVFESPRSKRRRSAGAPFPSGAALRVIAGVSRGIGEVAALGSADYNSCNHYPGICPGKE